MEVMVIIIMEDMVEATEAMEAMEAMVGTEEDMVDMEMGTSAMADTVKDTAAGMEDTVDTVDTEDMEATELDMEGMVAMEDIRAMEDTEKYMLLKVVTDLNFICCLSHVLFM